ncbi:MAG: hypothetical protein K9L30_18675 [Desulfobacterales bacterium]|nr:hypothetical protein [Desulfobacterales bacterium]
MEKFHKEILERHLPYRMVHLDGLCWACDLLLSGNTSVPVSIIIDGVTNNTGSSVYFLTNPLVESGLLYCRVFLGFLGISLNRKTQQLAQIEKPGTGDDFSLTKLGLPSLTVNDLRSAPTGRPEEIEASCQRTLLSTNKGVAHFTDSDTPGSQAQDALCCANTVIWLIEEYVYKKLDIPIPFFKFWTNA